MKHTTTILIICIFSLTPYLLNAQLDATTASKIKNSLITVNLSGHFNLDTSIVHSFKKYWTFNDKIVFQKSDGGHSMSAFRPQIEIDLAETFMVVPDEFSNGQIGEFSLGTTYLIGLRLDESFFSSGFNRFSYLGKYDIVESLKRFNWTINEVLSQGSVRKVYKSIKEDHSSILEGKELLVDARLLKRGLNEKAFRSIYPYDFRIVDVYEIEKAVLENDSTKAYVCISEENVGIYNQFICDAGTGQIYSYHYAFFHLYAAVIKKMKNKRIGRGDLKTLCKRL